MLTTIAVLALVGFAGGYAIAISELFADRREWWERRRDVNYGLLHDMLDELDPPLGTVKGAPTQVPIPAARKHRAGWRLRWALNYLLSCGLCLGWHVIWLAMVWWAAVAHWDGGTAPYEPATAPLIWLAACALHTVAMSAAGRVRLFGGDDEQ